MITVSDFLELCIDPIMQEVYLWSLSKEETVFSGFADDIYDTDFASEEVHSFDAMTDGNNILTINID